MSAAFLNHSSVVFSDPVEAEVDSQAEEEIDELDSDSETGAPPPRVQPPQVKAAPSDRESTTSPEPTGKNGRSGGTRLPGHSLLPAVRLENIIQADGVTGHLALSKEGLFLVSVATEEFIKRLAQGGQRQASAERRHTVTYTDMSDTTQQYQEFRFLQETIPPPLTLAEALQLRDAKEKELSDEDPAMTSSSAYPSISYQTAGPSQAKSRSKARPSTNGNGNLSLNSHASGSAHGRQEVRGISHGYGESTGHGILDARPWTHWATDPHAHGRPDLPPHPPSSSSQNAAPNGSHHPPASSAPETNGHSPSVSRSGTVTPAAAPSRDETMEPPAPPPSHYPPHTTYTSQFTGPASGFLAGPAAPFGQNLGRTIYSQQEPE